MIPWRRYREIGMGVLGWAPSEFWKATPHDLMAALDGWLEAKGAKKAGDLSAEDVGRLRTMLDTALKNGAGHG